ncbi:unnamed protein product [Rhodiola kirilowii]
MAATSLQFCSVRSGFENSSISTPLHQFPSSFNSQRLAFFNFCSSSLKLSGASGTACGTRRTLRVCCCQKIDALGKENETAMLGNDGIEKGMTCVMKFGGSSLASAERTNKLLLAGEKAVSGGVSNTSEIDELGFIRDLHLR